MISGPLAGPLRSLVWSAVCAVALAGCSSHDDPPPPQPTTVTTTFRGVFAGKAGERGTVTLTTTVTTTTAITAGVPEGSNRFPTGPSIERRRSTGNVTGSFNIVGGGTAALTGTYESATGVLRATGGGFVFTAALINGQLIGNYSSPGNGGSFVAVVPASAYAAYCGTWSGSDSGGSPDAGTVCFIVDGPTITGSATHDNGAFEPLTGSAKGALVIFTFTAYAFSGTITGPEAHGDYESTIASRSGGWSATLTAF